MLTLAEYPFERVDGLELSSELVRIGTDNLSRAGFRKGSILQGDAAEFQDLNRYTFFYFYNPFPESVLARAPDNIVESQRHAPREITLVYMSPVGDSLIRGAGFREVASFRFSMRWRSGTSTPRDATVWPRAQSPLYRPKRSPSDSHIT